MILKRCAGLTLIVLAGPAVWCQDFPAALEDARERALRHRYAEAIEILAPFSGSEDPEIRYITSAEIGRAYFHQGQYKAAYRALREAVVLHPERPETAIYLEAAAYLTGDTKQAFLIFEELLKSGARDLYLAVTLSGSRKFLAEPLVQSLLDQYSIPLEVDAPKASAMGVSLGLSHEVVIERLGATAADPKSRTLTAEAGPAVIWAFVFDDQQCLSEIVIHAGHLLEYTPYRLQFAAQIDWSATPAVAIAAWGPPSSTNPGPDRSISMTWQFKNHHLTIDFGAPGAYRPPNLPEGAAMIRSLRLQTRPPTP